MDITITVSEKMFKSDIDNKFQDFFSRVIADIATNLNNGKTAMCGRYEMETATLLLNAFSHGEYD